MSMNVIPRTLNAYTTEKLAVSVGITTFTAEKYKNLAVANYDDRQKARACYFTVEDDQVRYQIDGSSPDATTGHLLNVGDVFWLDSLHAIANFKVTRVTGDAILQVTYLR